MPRTQAAWAARRRERVAERREERERLRDRLPNLDGDWVYYDGDGEGGRQGTSFTYRAPKGLKAGGKPVALKCDRTAKTAKDKKRCATCTPATRHLARCKGCLKCRPIDPDLAVMARRTTKPKGKAKGKGKAKAKAPAALPKPQKPGKPGKGGVCPKPLVHTRHAGKMGCHIPCPATFVRKTGAGGKEECVCPPGQERYKGPLKVLKCVKKAAKPVPANAVPGNAIMACPSGSSFMQIGNARGCFKPGKKTGEYVAVQPKK